MVFHKPKVSLCLKEQEINFLRCLELTVKLLTNVKESDNKDIFAL